jgi:restriction system protein
LQTGNRFGPSHMNDLPWNSNSWEVAAQIAARWHRNVAAQNAAAAASMASMNTAETPLPLRTADRPQALMQAVIVPGARTNEGKLIEAVALPWFDIIALLKDDPTLAFQISPEKWEEIVAGAYNRAGFDEVTLTPRSGDYGRDVIAVKKGIGSVRVIDQVKAFRPPHLVTANDVRALMGVLQGDGASKGFVTTTSDFAPGIMKDPLITPLMPAQLELVNGSALMARLQELARKSTNDHER